MKGLHPSVCEGHIVIVSDAQTHHIQLKLPVQWQDHHLSAHLEYHTVLTTAVCSSQGTRHLTT